LTTHDNAIGSNIHSPRIYSFAKRDSGNRGPVRNEKRVLKQRMIASLVLMVIPCASGVRAQEPSTPKTDSSVAVDSSISAKQSATFPKQEHRFWDKKNAWLFAGVGASRALDYSSTLNLRRRGDREILVTNDLVDNHAAFAVVEATGTAVSIGASYLFHRSGHHKLERWTSIVHIGLSTSGAVRNYCLKTAHPKIAP
jgi:hypothetical protein